MSASTLARLLGDWRSGTGPLYERLGQRCAQLLADGRLAAGTRLPAERRLAERLAVSRTTTTRGYRWLRQNGLLESRQGSGSVTRLGGSGRTPRATTRSPDGAQLIDLTIASPLPPPSELVEVLGRALARSGTWLQGHGYDPIGLTALREAVATRYCRRGLDTRPEQIMVTCGAQQALALLSRLLVRRGDVVLVESPTYSGALAVLRAADARLASCDVAETGWHPARIVELAAQTNARVAYLVPDFHNPTGRLMLDDERRELMTGLARLPITVIADETLVELGLGCEAALPLQAPHGACAVISVGSLSKAVWAGLRVGWIRASESLIATLSALRSASDLGGPLLEQTAAVELLENLDEIVARRRELLVGQRDLVVRSLREDLGWQVTAPDGGLSVWARLPEGSSSALAEAAPRFGLSLAAGSSLSADGALDSFVRIPFALPSAVLTDAMGRLQAAYDAVRSAARPRPRLVV